MIVRRRAQFHREVAEALERLYGETLEEWYEQLAQHYEQAGVEEKAVAYLLKAGDKARSACLHEAARHQLSNSMQLSQGLAALWAPSYPKGLETIETPLRSPSNIAIPQ